MSASRSTDDPLAAAGLPDRRPWRDPIDPELYARMLALEDSHWWFSGLWQLVSRSFGGAAMGASRPRVLDAGCGTGGMMARLSRARSDWKVTGVDSSALALSLARRRHQGGLARARVEALPFPDNTFDIVTCLDVLYVEGVDDCRALAEILRVLRPCGRLILNLPAFEWLRGAHDVACATRHRYTVREVRTLLRAAGFTIRLVSYWNALLLPLLVPWRMAGRGGARSDLRSLPGVLNAALAGLVRAEARIALARGLPLGSSVFAVALKPPG